MTDRITTFVTFTMPAGSEERFRGEWLKDQPFMSAQPGSEGGAMYFRNLRDGRVRFRNVAHWAHQADLDAAREAVKAMRGKEGRNQERLFEELGVSWEPEEYVVAIPYGEDPPAED